MSSAYPPASGQMMRRCLRCGTPLPHNGTICGSCGAYNALAQIGWGQNQGPVQGQFPAQPQQPQWSFQDQRQWPVQGQASQVGQAPPGPLWGNGSAPAATNQGQYNGWGQTFPPGVPGNVSQQLQPLQPPGLSQPLQPLWPSQTMQAAQSSSQFQPFPMPTATGSFMNGASNGNGYYQGTQVGTFDSQATGLNNTYASYDYYQAQQEKRRPRVGFVIVIGLLALLVIGGGLTGFLYLNGQKQNSITPTPTFVITTPTSKPLFHDTFTNNNTNWPISNTPGVSFERVGGGLMTIEDDNNQLQWEILPGKTFADFRLDVNATLTKGDPSNAYGVYIRGASTANSPLGTYYRLELYGDGTFAIFKGTLDGNGNTVDSNITYKSNAAILTEGHTNHITIIAKGSNMTFMVNGVTIDTYRDTAYRGGLIALFVSNLPKLPKVAQATFANLAIFPPG